MGDVGSMAIGGVIAAMAILTRTELLAVLVAGVFVIGPGSVILQRLYFKLTRGKRLFLMSPFHHHLEMRGWSEITIVVRMWIIAGLLAVSGVGFFYVEWLVADMSAPRARRPDELARGLEGPARRRARALGHRLLGRRHARRARRRRARRHREGRRGVRAAASRDRRAAVDRARSTPCRRSSSTSPPRSSSPRPGFAPRHPVIAWAQESGVALWGDIELAWRVRDKVVRADGTPADWILVTGTNGKTTTTRLTATMLVAGGLRAAPVGNIGTPVLDAVRDPAGFDALVVELSSHQLWYLGLQDGPDPVSPHASVCLNLADDHLEWHGSFEAYRDAKAHVYDNTRVACVYNKADAATRRMVEDAEVVEGARAIGFDLGVPGPSDLGVVDGILVDRAFLDDRRTSALELTTVAELAELGTRRAAHRREHPRGERRSRARSRCRPRRSARRCAASGSTRTASRSSRSPAGVTWVDDSKATNPHAAASSLAAYPGAVWVVGGLLKGVDISDLVAGRGAAREGRDRDRRRPRPGRRGVRATRARGARVRGRRR